MYWLYLIQLLWGVLAKIVNGKAEMVIVKSGRNFGDKVEIINGLSVGDEVVTSGQINIDNGTPIKIVE